jgi:hypothetical protein
LIIPAGRNPGDFLVYLTSKAGEIFFFGDAVNLFLFAALPGRLSFMSLVGRAVTQASDSPNIAELAGHVARTVGGPEFGHPRLPPSVELAELPRAALARNWGKVSHILRDQRPAEWPVFIAAAAFRIIFGSKDAVAPPLALKILFEAAVPMSKLNPATVEQSGIPAPSLADWSQRAMKPENHQQILADVGAVMPKGALPAPQAAPVIIEQPSIAFLNLIGPDTNAMAEADRQAIGGPFRQATASAGKPVPTCDILFLYCRLEPSGSIAPYNIFLRDVIGKTGARIAVVASEIPPDLARNTDF